MYRQSFRLTGQKKIENEKNNRGYDFDVGSYVYTTLFCR